MIKINRSWLQEFMYSRSFNFISHPKVTLLNMKYIIPILSVDLPIFTNKCGHPFLIIRVSGLNFQIQKKKRAEYKKPSLLYGHD